MSSELRFDDRVVIVTGAGGGLGKCYALAFAARGAKVVVNDLGGGVSGDGKGTKAADLVVEEIKAKNGIAVANYDSVEEGEKIVETAVQAFGRIDIIINNAGILRDKSFLRTSDIDWDLIHRVHLRGSFILTRAAWPHMQKNKFGRVIMTSSGAGIYGNFGQANYSAAKLGLLGLSNTLSLEGKKYNITCNTIAPVAKSRLTENIIPEEMLNMLKPEYVAPLVMYLCHESVEESGSLFEVGGGWIGKVRWQKSSGALVVKQAGASMSPEEVRDKWQDITSFENPVYHTAIAEATNYCIEAVTSGGVPQSAPAKPKSAPSSSSSSEPPNSYTYDFKEVILYALSLGVSTADSNNLKFLYENHDDFCVLPSFGVIPAFSTLFSTVASMKLPYGLQIDPAKILHGEHYLEIFKPFKTSGTLQLKTSLVDVFDKGSGATIIMNVELIDENNERVALNQFCTFSVGNGNFGGKRDSDDPSIYKVNSDKKFTQGTPDASISEKTTLDQAAIYRLNGDLNPLHIDPSFGSMMGFEKPILHGLCSFGFAAKHILKTFCDNDVNNFKAIKVRFAKPVLPGQTIQTNMWLNKQAKRVYFECKVVETQAVVISGAYVDLRQLKNSDASSAAPAAATTAPSTQEVQFASERLFDEMSLKLKDQPDLSKINAVYSFRISKGDVTKVFLVDLKKLQLTKHTDKEDVKSDCQLILKDEDFVALSDGSANAQQMFMKGKLKIKGNIMLAQKLEALFKAKSKL